MRAQNGVATFTGLELNRMGYGYQIKVATQEATASTRTGVLGVVSDLQGITSPRLHARSHPV